MKILIATDGSEFSTAAVEKCCDLIKLTSQASIKIISAVEDQVPMAAEPFAISADVYKRLDAIAKQNAQTNLTRAAEIIKVRVPGMAARIETATWLGRPAETII